MTRPKPKRARDDSAVKVTAKVAAGFAAASALAIVSPVVALGGLLRFGYVLVRDRNENKALKAARAKMLAATRTKSADAEKPQ